METTVDREKTGKSWGRASLILGIATWAIYLAIVAVYGILSTIHLSDQIHLLLAFGISLPVGCGGPIANAVGVALGVDALRHGSAGQDRRRWAIAVGLNALPLILYCVGGSILATRH